MVRLAAICVAFAVGVATLPAQVLAADLALVIGNQNYRNAQTAPGSIDDAQAVREALEDAGYEVLFGTNASERQMQRLLSQFGKKVGSADRSVVYFTGHAVYADGVNYLAPTDMDNDSLPETVLSGVPLSLVLSLAGRNPGESVVFLDTAQRSGFPSRPFLRPGLGRIDPGRGVMVVSATAPSQGYAGPGRDESRFARQVIRRFLRPGMDVQDAARRMNGVWVGGDARPRLELVDRRGGGRPERPMTPAEIEDALNLTMSQRRDVQQMLYDLGHDPRGIDGRFGPGTRTAARLWQRANNLTETGYFDAKQLELLTRQAREGDRGDNRDDRFWSRTGATGTAVGYRAYLERYSDGERADEARAALKRIARAGTDRDAVVELEMWRGVRDADQPRGYRDYLERYPTGMFLPEAEERLAEATRPRPVQPLPVQPIPDQPRPVQPLPDQPRPVQPLPDQPRMSPEEEEYALGLNRTDRLSVEQRLNYLNFPPGNIDGFFDASARQAIASYQRSRGFRPTGYLDQPTAVRLMEETGNSRPGIVIDGAEVLRQLLNGN